MFLATCWTGSSLFSIQLSSLSVMRRSTTASFICSMTCTGCGSRREYTAELAALVFRCRHNMAPPYLVRDLRWSHEKEALQRLRFSSTTDCDAEYELVMASELNAPNRHSTTSQQQQIVRLRTIGDRSFRMTMARGMEQSSC